MKRDLGLRRPWDASFRVWLRGSSMGCMRPSSFWKGLEARALRPLAWCVEAASSSTDGAQTRSMGTLIPGLDTWIVLSPLQKSPRQTRRFALSAEHRAVSSLQPFMRLQTAAVWEVGCKFHMAWTASELADQLPLRTVLPSSLRSLAAVSHEAKLSTSSLVLVAFACVFVRES